MNPDDGSQTHTDWQHRKARAVAAAAAQGLQPLRDDALVFVPAGYQRGTIPKRFFLTEHEQDDQVVLREYTLSLPIVDDAALLAALRVLDGLYFSLENIVAYNRYGVEGLLTFLSELLGVPSLPPLPSPVPETGDR